MLVVERPNVIFHGLSGNATLDGVLREHPYLYRLERSTEDCILPNGDLVAHKYRRRKATAIPVCTPQDFELPALLGHICMWQNGPAAGSTPWISTSVNFVYMIYEGLRRDARTWTSNSGLQLLIIDTSVLDPKTHPILLAKEALRRFPDSDSKETAENFSNLFQEVLIYGHVPRSAILALIPWTVVRNIILARYDRVTLEPSFRLFSESMYSSIRRRVTIGDLDEQEDALAFAAELLEGRLKDNKASTYASFATSFYLWGTRHRSSALRECSSFQELQDEFLELIACDLDFPADPVLEALHTTKPPLVEAAPIVDVALKAEETAEGACAVEIIPVTEVLPMEVVDTLDAEFEDMVLRFQRLTLDDPIVDYAVEMMLQIFKGWV